MGLNRQELYHDYSEFLRLLKQILFYPYYLPSLQENPLLLYFTLVLWLGLVFVIMNVIFVIISPLWTSPIKKASKITVTPILFAGLLICAILFALRQDLLYRTFFLPVHLLKTQENTLILLIGVIVWIFFTLGTAIIISKVSIPFLSIIKKNICRLTTVKKSILGILFVYFTLVIKTTLLVLTDTYVIGDAWTHLVYVGWTFNEDGYMIFSILGLPKGLGSGWAIGHPPAYIFMIGTISTVTHLSVGATYIIVLSILELILLIQTYIIAKNLFGSNRIAMIAVVLLSIPLYDYRRAPESIATIFLYGALIFFLRYKNHRRHLDLFLMLLFIGMIPLTNRTVLYFFVFLFPAFVIAYLWRKKKIIGTLVNTYFFIFVTFSAIFSFLIYQKNISYLQTLTRAFRKSTPIALVLPVIFFGGLLLLTYLLEKKLSLNLKKWSTLIVLALLVIFQGYSFAADRPYASLLLHPDEGSRFFFGAAIIALMFIGYVFYIQEGKHREIPYFLLCIPIFGYILPIFDGYIVFSLLGPEWGRMSSVLLPLISILAAYGLVQTLENKPDKVLNSIKEIRFDHLFALHSVIKRLIAILLIFGFVTSIFAAQLYLDQTYRASDMEGIRWLMDHAEEDSVLMADPWSGRIITGYFGTTCWGAPEEPTSPYFYRLRTSVLVFSNITSAEKRELILENNIDYILLNIPKLKLYFQQNTWLSYMHGRIDVFSQITEEYGKFEDAYKDLKEITELVEVYNLGDNKIIIYQVRA